MYLFFYKFIYCLFNKLSTAPNIQCWTEGLVHNVWERMRNGRSSIWGTSITFTGVAEDTMKNLGQDSYPWPRFWTLDLSNTKNYLYPLVCDVWYIPVLDFCLVISYPQQGFSWVSSVYPDKQEVRKLQIGYVHILTFPYLLIICDQFNTSFDVI
jgi:hypothetical protein